MRFSTILFLGVLAVAFLGPSPRPCDGAISGVIYNSQTGHWYKLVHVSSGTVNWASAKTSAEGLGGYLATITSSSENSWILSNGLTNGGGGGAFIGGSDAVSEGNWRWVSGEPWSYTKWAPGEPHSPPTGGDYLRILTNGTWAEIGGSGSVTKAYIVEWNSDPNGGGPGPGPGPGPVPAGKVDLQVSNVRYSPSDPAPGEVLTVDFSAKNNGEDGVDSCAASLELVGYEREDDDGPFSRILMPAMGKGSSLARTFKVVIPKSIPPGEYPVRIVVSPTDGSVEMNVWNNSLDATEPLYVEQDVIEVLPGEKLKGTVGPKGRQEFRLKIPLGLRGSLKAASVKAEATKWLGIEGDQTPMLEATGKSSLKFKFRGEPEQTLLLCMESDNSAAISYTTAFKGKIRLKGMIDIGPDPVELPIHGFSGGEVSLSLKGEKGVTPHLDVSSIDDSIEVKANGKGAKVKQLVLEGVGPWSVTVSSAEGTSGRCAWSLKVK